MMKYIQYSLMIIRLERAIKRELSCKKFCEELGIDFEDLNLRNLKDRVNKLDKIWLERNAIN